MSLSTRRELLVRELQELYGAEQQLLIALPLMLSAATSPLLADAIRAHLGPKLCHVLRLEECLALLGATATAIPSTEMDQLVHEAAELARVERNPRARDARLIRASQRVEHFEISAYGACLASAEALGEESIAMLLRLTLDEERASDLRLAAIALSEVDANEVLGGRRTFA